MVARTLITTAKENTWPKDKKKPVLFLGDWCKLYQRKSFWQDMESKTASYHWDDRKKLLNDYRLLQDIHEKFLLQLSGILNKIHNTNHSVRYWRILIGPWLGWFVQIIFDRWFMLNKVIEEGEIDHCIVIKRNLIDVATNDMSDFCNSIIYDDLNEAICGQLLQICWKNKVDIELINDQKTPKKQINNLTWQDKIDSEKTLGLKNIIREKIKKLLPIFNKLFPKDNGYFFISSYLPLLSGFKLQMRLGQFPKLWKAPFTPVVKADKSYRQWSLDLNNINTDSFEALVARLIPQHLPKVYLEGYDILKSVSEKLPWPSKPKAIFTGTPLPDTEVFKIWVAEKTEDGVPLVIAQHGGHYGTSPFAFLEEHEIKIADKWISWGWSDESRPQIIPVGNLKAFGSDIEYDPKGGALMVELTIPRYSYFLKAATIAGQFLNYFQEQKVFLNTLPKVLREKVLIRVNNVDYDWSLPSRFNDLMPEVEVDFGHQNIRNLIKKSRLYISTYNATTYLESMAWNIPTIIFWNEEHWELKEDVKPYFELLKSAGIFHNSPQSAARQMVDIWDNVDDWWLSESVQKARLVFCKQFSNMPKDPLGELEMLFKSI